LCNVVVNVMGRQGREALPFLCVNPRRIFGGIIEDKTKKEYGIYGFFHADWNVPSRNAASTHTRSASHHIAVGSK